MAEYLVSVIIPAYNAEKTLPRAVESVMRQTLGFERIELLLCDDCSADGSFALIQKYAAEYPNIKALRTEKNSGDGGLPRNLAMRAATAPYLMFLDGDDVYFDHSAQTLYSAITENDADIASGDWTMQQNGVTSTHRHKAAYGVKDTDIFSSFDAEPFVGALWRTIFKREIVEKYALQVPESCSFEDIAFTMSYLMFCKKGVYVGKSVYNWLRHPGSISTSREIKSLSNQTLTAAKAYWSVVETERRFGLRGAAEKCFKLYGDAVSTCIDELLNTTEVGDELLKTYFLTWKDLLLYHAENGYELASPGAAVLANDFLNCGDETAIRNFFELRRFCRLRQRELDEIFGSTTWKLVSGVQKLKFWKR